MNERQMHKILGVKNLGYPCGHACLNRGLRRPGTCDFCGTGICCKIGEQAYECDGKVGEKRKNFRELHTCVVPPENEMFGKPLMNAYQPCLSWCPYLLSSTEVLMDFEAHFFGFEETISVENDVTQYEFPDNQEWGMPSKKNGAAASGSAEDNSLKTVFTGFDKVDVAFQGSALVLPATSIG